MRVRRADEVDEPHLVTLHVVEEDALSLDEALVLLAGHALADEARLDVTFLDDERALGRDDGFGHSEAALIASTMFT